MRYPALRTIHLLCGAFALPMLAMYAASAVQMAHNDWFAIRSRTSVAVSRAVPSGGEIESKRQTPGGFEMRLVVPGTVREVHWESASGTARVRTTVAGFWGMLNRLHHAAGLWHEYLPLRLWAALVALVSLAALGLAASGIWMWWLRREERQFGLALIAANVVFAIAVLALIRAAGP